jgi:hypothetical protein
MGLETIRIYVSYCIQKWMEATNSQAIENPFHGFLLWGKTIPCISFVT